MFKLQLNSKVILLLSCMNIIIRIILIVICLYFYYRGWIEGERIIRFLFILLIICSYILVWKFIYDKINKYVKKNKREIFKKIWRKTGK